MRIATISQKLTMATLGLGVAVSVAMGFGASVALAAEAGPQGPAGVPQGQGQQQKTGQDTEGKNIDPITGEEVKKTSVIQYINAVYIWLAFIGGLLAIISLIYAGYSYMGSYGDPEKIANAKDIVEKTLIGLSLLILAALILNSINPRTIEKPCKPNEPGCGDIDFTKPGG